MFSTDLKEESKTQWGTLPGCWGYEDVNNCTGLISTLIVSVGLNCNCWVCIIGSHTCGGGATYPALESYSGMLPTLLLYVGGVLFLLLFAAWLTITVYIYLQHRKYAHIPSPKMPRFSIVCFLGYIFVYLVVVLLSKTYIYVHITSQL